MATPALSEDRIDVPPSSMPDIPELESPDQLEAWADLLFKNPGDQKLWNTELARQIQRTEKLSKQERESPLDPKLKLTIANSYQSQGIALRHLKRYEEALSALTHSIDVLAQMEKNYECKSSSSELPICGNIYDGIRLTFIYFANVYYDLSEMRNTEKYLERALEVPSTFEDFRHTLSRLVSLYLKQDDFQSALNIVLTAIEDELEYKHTKEVVTLSEMASSIYLRLFYTISWIPGTSDLRENDPRDFADRSGIGIGSNVKYGMTDPEEDSATFATLFFLQELANSNEGKEYPKAWGYRSYDDLLKNTDIEAYIRSQLADRNLEPAAKYLYNKYIRYNFGEVSGRPFSCPNEQPNSVTFTEVRKAIETGGEAIPHWTRYVIDLLFEGEQFLRTYCSKLE